MKKSQVAVSPAVLISLLTLSIFSKASAQTTGQWQPIGTSSSSASAHYDGKVGVNTGSTTIGSSPFYAPLTLHQSTSGEGRLLTFYRDGDTTKRWSLYMAPSPSNYWCLAWEVGTTPYCRMQVSDSGTTQFFGDGPAGTRSIFTFRLNSADLGDSGQWSINAVPSSLYWQAPSMKVPLVMMNATGYVGVLTDPVEALHVKGKFRFGSGSTNTDLVMFTDPAALNYTVGGSSFAYTQHNSIMPVDLPATSNTTIRTAIHLKSNVGPNQNINQVDLIVDGNIAAKYQDVAEWVPATESLPPGSVVSIDSTESNVVRPSRSQYETAVAGVVSALPGLVLGEAGTQKLMIATTGRVKVRVDATQRPIKRGDLLVTSNRTGTAMASVPVDVGGIRMHRPGTVIGKALEPLQSGQGEILVLLTLQ